VDPLEPDGIEARIVGVITPPAAGKDGTRLAGKAGTETKIRAVDALIKGTKIGKDGTETRVRDGTETRVRAGTEAKIKGEGVQFVWGNPPDGFYQQDADE
jgi:hypothetical protein